MIRLYVIWKSRHIHCKLKYNLYRSLFFKICTYIYIYIYIYKASTINASMQKKLQAFENKSHRKLLDIKRTNAYTKEKIKAIIGKYDPIVHIIKLRKLKLYCHAICIYLDMMGSVKRNA